MSIFGALAGIPLLPEAACRGRWELFDMTIPENPGKLATEVTLARAAAVNLCNSCAELSRCREWLDSQPPTRRPYGVTAGRIRRIGNRKGAA